jgi:hypothetical protein
MQPFRFLLYCLSSVAGVVGSVVGGCPVISYVFLRLFGFSYSVVYEELFHSAVIFFLSLILLILVHIGHRLVGAFSMSMPKKPAVKDSPDNLIV